MRIHLEQIDYIHPESTPDGIIELAGSTKRDMIAFGLYLTDDQAEVLCEQIQAVLKARKKAARS